MCPICLLIYKQVPTTDTAYNPYKIYACSKIYTNPLKKNANISNNINYSIFKKPNHTLAKTSTFQISLEKRD